jgi:hypothetical protein
MTGHGDRPVERVESESDRARPDPSQVLAALAADGPDEMGRDLAGAPEVVEATLTEVRLLSSRLQPLFDSRANAVLVGTGMSLAVAQTAAPWWRLARRRPG